MASLAEFFSREAGQKRRQALDSAISEGLRYYLGPTGIPQRLGLVNEVFNPVVGIEQAGLATEQAMDPSLPASDRAGAALRAATEVAGVVAPAVGARVATGLAGQTGTSLADDAARATTALADTFSVPVGNVGQDMVERLNQPGPMPTLGSNLGNVGATPRPKKPGQFTSVDVRTPGEFFYSPSQLASMNLRQGKGTYEQIRKALISGGAKDAELQWSGFDRQFGNRTDPITRDEVQKFFRRTPDPYEEVNFTSTGRLGDDMIGQAELEEAFMRANLTNEIDYIRNEYYPERLSQEARAIRDMDIDDLQDLADNEGYESVEDFLEDFGEGYEYDGMIASDENEAGEIFFGDPDLEAEESLRNQFNDMMAMGEEEALREQLNIGPGFDEGDTEFSNYFTKGGTDYSENLFVQPDQARELALGDYPSERPADHWSEPNMLFHTRTANFDTPAGARVHHVGEIQSDWGQSGRSKETRVRTLSEELSMANMEDALRDLHQKGAEAEYAAAELSPYEPHEIFAVRQIEGNPTSSTAVRTMAGDETLSRPPDYPTGRFAEVNTRDRRFNVPEDRVPTPAQITAHGQNGRETIPGRIPQPWDPTPLETGATPRMVTDRPQLAMDWVARNQPLPEDGLPGFAEDPRYLEARAWNQEYGNTQQEYEDLAGTMAEMVKREPAGPYVRQTNDWVDQALRAEFEKALRSRADYMTTGTGELASDMTMGRASGQTEFYDRIVPRRLERLAKQFGTDVERVNVQFGEGRLTVPGIKLTPELRDMVREKGIPFFAIPGGMVVLGANSPEEYQAQMGVNESQPASGQGS